MSRKFILTTIFVVLCSLYHPFAPARTAATSRWVEGERRASTETARHRAITQGELLVQDAAGQPRGECPLKHTQVKATVSGFLARVNVTQEFHNPFDEKIEAIYVFPLPQNSAVDDLTMLIGDRTVRGLIKRREEARALYEQARTAGKAASLLDQERPNIFTQSVANIPPGATVKVVISYVETLKYEDGAYEFVFPMVVGPRYMPQPDETNNDGTTPPAANPVPDAARIAPPVLPEGERPGHDVSIEVSIDAGVPIEEVHSALHDVAIERGNRHSAVINLKDKETIPNRDFILKFSVGGRRIEDALLAHRDAKGGYFTLILQPPDRVAAEDVTPKELVFVLDTSGSMEGIPIEAAKKAMKMALDNLYPQDTFNLITFAGDTHILFDQPVPATKENLKKAQSFLESRKGGGGTEMMKAIRAALDETDQQNHVRIVCFMTDGYVGNDMEIIAEVKKHPNARVFAFGIGNSVNRFLLDKMAERGRGEVEYVPVNRGSEQDTKTAAAAAKRFHERVRSPLLTDVTVDWGGLPVADVYPKQIPDLFSAKPLIFSGRYAAGARGVIRLRGKTGTGEVVREIPVELPAVQPQHDVLATLWARQRIDDLMAEDYNGIQRNQPREEIKEAITQIGLEYRLMTQFTSFVAVEEAPVTEGVEPRRIAVPVAIPNSVNYNMVVGSTNETVQIESSSASVTVSVNRLDSFPLSIRSVADLAQLTPGTTLGGAQTQSPRGTAELIAGLRDVTTALTVDGSDSTNAVIGGSLPAPATNAMQEMHITTSGATADQGSFGPTSVAVATQSGTNSWHGGASFYGRSGRLSALPAAFDSAQNNPSFHREEYDGALGGPILKDHLFWFSSFAFRNQRGLMQFGERDLAAHTIKQRFRALHLNELSGTFRMDWNATDRQQFRLQYLAERGEGTSSAILQRTLGSASQLQTARNDFDSASLRHVWTLTPTVVNEFQFGFNRYRSTNAPLNPGLQLNFPSLQDGAPFRVPSIPRQNRWQIGDAITFVRGTHSYGFGAEIQRLGVAYDPGFGANGLLEFAEDFASTDRNGDGKVDDQDLRLSFALRPIALDPLRQTALTDTHVAAYAQDSWRLRTTLTLNYGLRWQFDTNEKNLNGVGQLNPLVLPFLTGKRERNVRNFAPRVGFAWAKNGDRLVVHGGYGLFYDRIPLQFAALEQLLDGRRISVGAYTGGTLANPFAGTAIVPANAPGIQVLDNGLQNPLVQQINFGIERLFATNWTARAEYVHNVATRLPIGRTVGSVLNPVTGLPDRIVRLESAASSQYDALLISVEKRTSSRSMLRAHYTLAKAFNYTNGDQLPFFMGIVDPQNLRLEYGPSPTDQRHRFGVAGDYELWQGWRMAAIWTLASGLPMDILLPDASTRVPWLQRNAGGRLFHTGAELNRFLRQINTSGGINGTLLPLVRDEARFNDGFQSFDLRLSKEFKFGGESRLEFSGELFNLFNTTNILGVSNANPSGFANVLTRDSNNSLESGFLRASGFGRPVTSAGGMFGAGGPRALQLLVKFKF